ncbi:hypothetical protein H4R24_001492 [Coemansia sp. RSA 988]|nr:hypothetical protein H4R24_001492 [Coemansia sp. RSA 988]
MKLTILTALSLTSCVAMGAAMADPEADPSPEARVGGPVSNWRWRECYWRCRRHWNFSHCMRSCMGPWS